MTFEDGGGLNDFVGGLDKAFLSGVTVDAMSGELKWKFQTGSTIRGQPISYEIDGRQYIAVPSGGGGLVVEIAGQPPITTLGSTLVVFSVPQK